MSGYRTLEEQQAIYAKFAIDTTEAVRVMQRINASFEKMATEMGRSITRAMLYGQIDRAVAERMEVDGGMVRIEA